jgi:hypothetical protein
VLPKDACRSASSISADVRPFASRNWTFCEMVELCDWELNVRLCKGNGIETKIYRRVREKPDRVSD